MLTQQGESLDSMDTVNVDTSGEHLDATNTGNADTSGGNVDLMGKKCFNGR